MIATIPTTHLRELVRLALAAHGGFHGGDGKPLADYAAAGCKACAAIDGADVVLQGLKGRTEKVQLLDLNLGGKGPTS